MLLPVSTNIPLAFFPHPGLAKSGGARSLVTSWQTQVLRFCSRKNPGYLIAFGHLSDNCLEQTQSGSAVTDMSV